MSDTENVISFAELPLSEPVIQAVKDVGYETPSPIQAQSIPHILEGRDLLGLAQTVVPVKRPLSPCPCYPV